MQKLNNKHLKAIQLLVYSDKLKQEIAAEVGVSATTLSAWISDPVFDEAVRAEMHRGFNYMALKARRKLDNLIDDPNSQVALAASKETLNKAGYQEVQNINQTLTTDIKIEIED